MKKLWKNHWDRKSKKSVNKIENFDFKGYSMFVDGNRLTSRILMVYCFERIFDFLDSSLELFSIEYSEAYGTRMEHQSSLEHSSSTEL